MVMCFYDASHHRKESVDDEELGFKFETESRMEMREEIGVCEPLAHGPPYLMLCSTSISLRSIHLIIPSFLFPHQSTMRHTSMFASY